MTNRPPRRIRRAEDFRRGDEDPEETQTGLSRGNYGTIMLDRLLAGDRDFEAMRADRWAAAHPEALRPYRIAEARYRADEKATRRARRRAAEPAPSGDQ